MQHLDGVSFVPIVSSLNVSQKFAGTARNPRSLPEFIIFCSKFQERLRKSTEILRNILGLDICQSWRVDILVDNQSPPSSSQRVANRQPRSGYSSERTRRAEPGVRVGLAKIARACLCAHAAYSSKRLSARDKSGSSASFLRKCLRIQLE